MLRIKKIDILVTRNFLTLLAGAFFVCLFVLMMQFTWRYIDELIGKGLTMDVFAEFFWYMALTLVPQALPLSILLASLIAFGNMGEQLELLAMKTVGVPLVRIMRPLVVVVTLIAGGSFYFQNVTGPNAELRLRTLLLSMRESAPAFEIPEGVFYNGIPNFNIYVKDKRNETGMLYEVIIYKTDQGFDKAQIVLADSARIEVTADHKFLVLRLYAGEQFENLQAGGMGKARAYVPYDRETFSYKKFIIDFDSDFNVLDAGAVGNRPESKDMRELVAGIDSMEMYADSLGNSVYGKVAAVGNLGPVASSSESAYRLPKAGTKKTGSHKVSTLERKRAAEAARIIREYAAREAKVAREAARIDFDSLVAALTPQQRAQAASYGVDRSRKALTELEWQRYETEDNDTRIRRYHIAWHQKIVMSLTCLIFFFIGAPLGSIIQKGGLGAPTVVSVLIFILYYIVSTSGMKLGREGTWQIWFGMWMSVMLLAPLGAFLTYKANSDSVVFNPEAYRRLARRLLGLRTRRHVVAKEVVVYDPDYAAAYERLGALAARCARYGAEGKLWMAPNYWKHFINPRPDNNAAEINAGLEALVDELSNSRDKRVIAELNHFPVIFASAHVSPFGKAWLNRAVGVVLPLGLFFWLRMWKFRLRLHGDLKQIVTSCHKVRGYIAGMPGSGKGGEKNLHDNND